MSYELLQSRRLFRGDMVVAIPETMYLESVLERYGMMKCKWSSSPKLDKAEVPGDGELLDESSRAKLGSAVLMLLYLSTTSRALRGFCA